MRFRGLRSAAGVLAAVTTLVASPAGSAVAATRGWSGWVALGAVTASGVSAVAQSGQVDLFYEGTDDRLWEDWETAGSGQWSGGIPVRPDGALTGTPLAIAPSPGVVDVFVRGTDSRIWETSFSGGVWSPWSAVGLSVNQTRYAPGGVVQGHDLDLFVTGTDGRLYQDFLDLTTNIWSGFFLVSAAGTLAGSPSAVSPAAGNVQVFGPGTDSPHHIYGITYSGNWSSWALIGTSANVTNNDVGATVQGGQVEVFVTGTDGYLWGNTEIGGSWTGFGLVNGRLTMSSGPGVVAGSNGLVSVFSAGTNSPHTIYEISNTGTGVYGCSASSSCQTMVQKVISGGWAGIGSVSGFCSAPSTSYACPTGADGGIQQSLKQSGGGAFWLSFWTIGAPVAASGSTTPDFSPNGWYTDGFKAGTTAGTEIAHLGGSYLPDYEILDAEGFGGYPGQKDSKGNVISPCSGASNSTCWASWINGWAAGLRSISSAMHPGFYTSQSPIRENGLLSLGVPAFPAVSPILGNTPFVTGSNVTGYIAYPAQCPADPYAIQVTNWGAQFNTVQFTTAAGGDNGVDCPA